MNTHVIPFNKTTGRFFKTKSPATYKNPVYISILKPKKNLSTAEKNKKNFVDFKRQLGRMDAYSHNLPCFMQMTGHSRTKVQSINAKSLEQNNYTTRDFLGLASTLNQKKSFRRVKKQKVRRTEKLFSRTGGFASFKKGKKTDYEDSYEEDSSLSGLFNDYDL